MNRIIDYLAYHVNSSKARDIDPQNEAIMYLCDRFELNMEQRCWLCFLYSTNYCVPTTYFMYNEFPDFATVDVSRLDRWWRANREKLIFQTDKRWIRSRNLFVRVFCSYRDLIHSYSHGTMSQYDALTALLRPNADPAGNYGLLCTEFNIYYFGRFGYFLYSELLHNVCGINVGVRFDIREAESSRNGLVIALGLEREAWTGHSGRALSEAEAAKLNQGLQYIADLIARLDIEPRHKSFWSIETTLCAYRKYKEKQSRWVGYYIERMRREIVKMEQATDKEHGGGVCWRPLWEFRRETYQPKYLKELCKE